MTHTFTNALKVKKELFVAEDSDHVTMYICGTLNRLRRETT